LKHAGLRCLQEATIVGDPPIDRANRLLPSDVTDSTANQHLRIDFSFFALEKSLVSPRDRFTLFERPNNETGPDKRTNDNGENENVIGRHA